MQEKGILNLYSPSEIGHHYIISLYGVSFNLDTIIMTWFAMLLVVVFAYFAVKKLSLKPKGAQLLFEMFLGNIKSLLDESIGKNNQHILPFISTLFIFIFMCNFIGDLPLIAAPTADINTTVSLGVFVFLFVQIIALYKQGLIAYIRHYFKPFPIFFPLNIIEELAKPITLSLRLFGNIVAGDVLLIVLNLILPKWFPFPTIIWMIFGLFVTVVQAFVFTLLTISYISVFYKKKSNFE